MTWAKISRAAAAQGLAVVGAFHPEAEDLAPEGTATLILLGPGGPDMWNAFTGSPEHADGAPHPMDRWSERVIGALATEFDAAALFPFGGPPYQPFQRWAVKGEGAVPSPVGMQASRARGLWVSYRGALALRRKIELPERAATSPCLGCDAPCLAACPVDAFASGRYDVPTCTAHLKAEAGADCLPGCRVRRACPYGNTMALPEAQRRFHIDAFLRSNG